MKGGNLGQQSGFSQEAKNLRAKGWSWPLSCCVLFCFPFCDLMAGIKATEQCLREQSHGKLLSVQRTVIKTDRFGLSVPMVPAFATVGREDHQEDPGGLGSPRKAGTSLRQASPYRRNCSSASSVLQAHPGSED